MGILVRPHPHKNMLLHRCLVFYDLLFILLVQNNWWNAYWLFFFLFTIVKKQTRQWAAWTRQEEESFFAALRQVGKANNLLLFTEIHLERNVFFVQLMYSDDGMLFSAEFWEDHFTCPEQKQGSGGFLEITLTPYSNLSLIYSNFSSHFGLWHSG